MQSVMQWKKKKAVKPHEMGLYSSPQAIQTPRRMALYAAYDACIDSFNSNLCLFFVVSVPLKEK